MLMKRRKDPKDFKCALVHLFATKPGLQRKGYCSFLFAKVFTRKNYFNHDAIYSCGRVNNNVFKLRSREVNDKEKMTEDDNFYYSELEGNLSWMTAEKLPLCDKLGFLSCAFGFFSLVCFGIRGFSGRAGTELVFDSISI